MSDCGFPACVDCADEGEAVPAVRTFDRVPVCAEHYRTRDNYEPPDPVDSDMFGSEAR